MNEIERDAEDTTQLINRCMIKHALPATSILWQALDQKELSTEAAYTAFNYIKPLYFRLLSCLTLIPRSPHLTTENLIWIAIHVGEKGDAYLPSLQILSERFADDFSARKFLKTQLKHVQNPDIRAWLSSVIKKHRGLPLIKGSGGKAREITETTGAAAEYPWWASFDEMFQFEKDTLGNWYCSVPQLEEERVTALVEKCIIPEVIPAMRAMEGALNKKGLLPETVLSAFKYIKRLSCDVQSCFGAITLATSLSTEDLIVVSGLFADNQDPYIHSLGNLAGRIPGDVVAWEFLKQQSMCITDPLLKNWLEPILKEHRNIPPPG